MDISDEAAEILVLSKLIENLSKQLDMFVTLANFFLAKQDSIETFKSLPKTNLLDLFQSKYVRFLVVSNTLLLQKFSHNEHNFSKDLNCIFVTISDWGWFNGMSTICWN